jgi:formylglycine-generating enzyme required for sulfatase activity
VAAGIDVEIRIREKQTGWHPVEITLTDQNNNRRHFEGKLESRSWLGSASPVEDGQRLFQWLFADEALAAAWERVSEYRPHRLRLRIDPGAPELHALPWELMREPIDDSKSRPLAAYADTPFSRYPAGDWLPSEPISDRPIKILVAIANPKNLRQYGLVPISVETEQGIIADAFQDLSSGQVDLTFLEPPITKARLAADLERGYDFLHIFAHGRYSEQLKEAALFLTGDAGNLERLGEGDLAAMIDRLSQDQRPKLIILGSCQSATRDTTCSFRGLAPALLGIGVPTVLAMQDRVPVVTAREFTRVFYRELFVHGQVDLAGNQARSALLTGGFTGSSIPVLFSRPSNQLVAPLSGTVVKIRPFEPETVYVPAGKFLMGSQAGQGIPAYETPQHRVSLPAFRIGKYPVTNREYAVFLRENKGKDPPTRAWARRHPPAGKLDHPVVGVSWYDAVEYCSWLSLRTKRSYRIPTEAEWEKASRGTNGQLYPWGDDWGTANAKKLANITPATLGGNERKRGDAPYHLEGASPHGCYDTVGNVQEWTSTLWGSSREEPDFPYPYDPDDGREDPSAERWVCRVCRGGPVPPSRGTVRCSSRGGARADSATRTRGFRVVMEV